MLTELNGKAGNLCQPAKDGTLRCALIVRPTSEDVVTGNLFGALQVLNPRWWLPDLLNEALGAKRFRRQVFRRLQINLWQKQQGFPRYFLAWDEGQTEVDVVISWENPPTTVFIEMKYGSAVSSTTIHNSGNNGYPSDQLIRNARVGLYQCGWYDEELLFQLRPRDFVLILLSPNLGNRLVQEYRDPERLRSAIPHGKRLRHLPDSPFIGELSYQCVVDRLKAQQRWFTRAEQILVRQLTKYLEFKSRQLRNKGSVIW